MTSKSQNKKGAKYRKEKREAVQEKLQDQARQEQKESIMNGKKSMSLLKDKFVNKRSYLRVLQAKSKRMALFASAIY